VTLRPFCPIPEWLTAVGGQLSTSGDCLLLKIHTDFRMMQTQAPPRRKVKIFGLEADLWTVYLARLAFRDKLIGGIPKDPKLIEGWLRNKAGIEDPQELRVALLRTLSEVGAETREKAIDEDELAQAAAALVSQKRTTGFKSSLDGLYVEGRQVKAMLKESTNVVFAGERWGPTRKAAKAFFAERVFIEPDKLTLGVHEPTGVEMVVGHLGGPTGPRSTLGNYEYVEQPTLEFRVLVLRDCITAEHWRDIWCHAQENGFGTLRSQGHGRFDVVQWDCLTTIPS
jgi:hypothetical protein